MGSGVGVQIGFVEAGFPLTIQFGLGQPLTASSNGEIFSLPVPSTPSLPIFVIGCDRMVDRRGGGPEIRNLAGSPATTSICRPGSVEPMVVGAIVGMIQSVEPTEYEWVPSR